MRRAVVVAACAAAFAAAIYQAPHSIHRSAIAARTSEQRTPVERELAGVLALDLDTTFLVRARELIPADASYAVVTGPNVAASNPVAPDAVVPFTAYWLLPRVRVDPNDAAWVVSYGADLKALGLRYARVVTVSPGIAIAEVKR